MLFKASFRKIQKFNKKTDYLKKIDVKKKNVESL